MTWSHTKKDIANQLMVTVVARYIESQSDPDQKRYVFSYTIQIKNESPVACQLLRRHWLIKDANRKVEEVYGDGVVGKQPVIQPGAFFEYSSSAVMETEIGTMEGRYFLTPVKTHSELDSVDLLLTNKPNEFHIPIPRFTLSIPRVLH